MTERREASRQLFPVRKTNDMMRFLLQTIAAGLIAFVLVTYFGSRNTPMTTGEGRPVVLGQAAPAVVDRREGVVSYATAARKAIPSVVNVYSLRQGRRTPFGGQQGGGEGLGSGVVVSDDGYILTNNHVVEGATEVAVALSEGKPVATRVVGTDPETDLAVLKIDARALHPIELADSDSVQIGDVVLAIGNPFGVGQTVTQGIVSGTGRNRVGINTFENFIQTDAAINPGNSGGALVDATGRLIGINTAILSPSGGSLGIGFAIPTRTATEVMKQLIEEGRVVRGWLGVEAQDVTQELARAVGIRATEGALVVRLVPGGPADRGGLRPGDVVVAVDGKRIGDTRDLVNATAAEKPGTQGEYTVIRDGNQTAVRVEVGRRPQVGTPRER
jgi:serine protease DegQ